MLLCLSSVDSGKLIKKAKCLPVSRKAVTIFQRIWHPTISCIMQHASILVCDYTMAKLDPYFTGCGVSSEPFFGFLQLLERIWGWRWAEKGRVHIWNKLVSYLIVMLRNLTVINHCVGAVRKGLGYWCSLLSLLCVLSFIMVFIQKIRFPIFPIDFDEHGCQKSERVSEDVVAAQLATIAIYNVKTLFSFLFWWPKNETVFLYTSCIPFFSCS